MAGVGTLVDLLLFYSLERTLFNRLVSSMGKTSHQVKRAIAFWLTLEENGYYDFIRTIYSLDDHSISALFNETMKCLDCLPLNAAPRVEFPDDLSAFLGLFDEPMNYRFFHYNREFIFRRFQHILQTVCEKIFGETAALEVDCLGLRPVARTLGSTASGEPSQEPRQSTLNPHAEHFHPGQTSKDGRTMFLTFSKGFPLSREEIFEFFTSNWGDVVQDVAVERTGPGRAPQFGRVVFTASWVIPNVLNGQAKAKFVVNGKHLWARIYVHGARN